MKKYYPILIFAFILIIFFPGECSGELITREIRVDEVTDIELTENPATGNVWRITIENEDIVEKISVKYQSPNQKKESPNRNTTRNWSFLGLQKGLTKIIFKKCKINNPDKILETHTAIIAVNIPIITIDKDDIAIIKLIENPSTGFKWHCDIKNPEIIKLVNSSYQQTGQKQKILGKRVIHTWQLSGIQSGYSRVDFELYRDWMPEEIEKIKQYIIIVK